MMFEKQNKSGIDKLKGPSSDLENPSALSLDAIQDSPGKDELEVSKLNHGKTGTDLLNTYTTLEEGSQKVSAQQEAPEDKAPEKSEPDIDKSSSHPTKRPRTDE